MRINRRFLYAGLFLFAIGGVLVATNLGAVDTAALADLLRLWPVAVMAIGAGIVLRRTRAGLAGGMLAAALPGLVLGGAIAVAPRFVGDCGARGEAASATSQGTFDGAARISVTADCGSLTVNTAPGNGWRLVAGNTAGRTPSVLSSSRSLSIGSSDHEELHFLDGGRDTWNLTLPTTDIDELSLVAFANQSHIDLRGARIQSLDLTANAADIVVDASAASVANLSAAVNVGALSIHLPAESDVTGSLRLGAGELQVCAVPAVGLRITTRGTANQVTVNGLQQKESVWESPNYATATHRADLRVSVNFGAVEINPIGGCR